MMLLKHVFCAPFCVLPACPLVLVHRFLLPQGYGAPLHFVPARSLDFHVLGGTLSAHPVEPQIFSNGPIRNIEIISTELKKMLHLTD